MHLYDVAKHLERRQEQRRLRYALGPPASDAAIAECEAHLGVSFSPRVRRFCQAFDGLRVEDPPIEIFPLDRLHFLAPNRLHFVTIDHRHQLCFDVSHLNPAGEWDVLRYPDDYRVTLTMSSFWSTKLWAWIDKRSAIWEPHPGNELMTVHLVETRWDCVHFLSSEDVAAVRTLPASDLGEVRRVKTAIFEINGSAIQSERDLLSAVSVAFRCPHAIAHWGGMQEFLLTLERPDPVADATGDDEPQPYSYILIVHSARPLWQTVPLAAGELISTWLFCAAQFGYDSVAFHLVFEM